MRAAAITRALPRLNVDQRRVMGALRPFGIALNADTWVWPALPGAVHNREFRWSTFLKPFARARMSQDEAGAVLRWLAACWLTGCGGECKPTRPRRVVNQLRDVRRLLCILLREKHSSLETITPRQAQRALEALYLDQNGACRATNRTVLDSVRSFQDLYRLRPYLPAAVVLDPFPLSFVRSICARAKKSVPWEAPPEPVCLELIRQAIRLLGPPADDIVRLREKYITACESTKKHSPFRNGPRVMARAALKGERFATLPHESEPWTDLDAEDPQTIKALVCALEGACAVILLFLSGPRVSEVQRAGPGSLQYVRHDNGIEYPYFFAERSKQSVSRRLFFAASERDRASRRGWILGPSGVRALEVLEGLSGALRKLSRLPSYWLTVQCSGLWPAYRRPQITAIAPATINHRLKSFVRFVELHERTGWRGRLHTHMGRKACARFIAKRDRTALADLAIQFGHLSAYITDVGYARPDAEYRRLIDEELAGELQEVAADLASLDIDHTFANMNCEAVAEIRDRAVRFLGQLLSEADVRRLLGRGVRLVPCDWGMCIYREELSACEGNEFGPSAERRSPAVCVKCMNFLATQKHRPFWQRRLDDCKRWLAHRDLPDQTQHLLNNRLAEAQAVLAAIGTKSNSDDSQ